MARKIRMTNRKYEEFKDACREWQQTLGLLQYTLGFDRCDLGSNEKGSIIFAQLDADEMGKFATLSLIDKYDPRHKSDLNIRDLARHEMLHLLSNRFYWLAIQRCLNPSDLMEEWEALTTRLENLTRSMS